MQSLRVLGGWLTAQDCLAWSGEQIQGLLLCWVLEGADAQSGKAGRHIDSLVAEAERAVHFST